jgi:hypothetical protein
LKADFIESYNYWWKEMLKGIRKHNRYRKQYNAWQEKYDARAPKAGDMSADFELFDVSGEHNVRLSDFQGHKPVALIFGSFT